MTLIEFWEGVLALGAMALLMVIICFLLGAVARFGFMAFCLGFGC